MMMETNSPTITYPEYLQTCRKIKVTDRSLEMGKIFVDTLETVNPTVYNTVKGTAFDITYVDYAEVVNIALTFFERIWDDA